MALRWKNSFSCNIKEIDEQHKKMLEIASKLNILEPICSKRNFEDEIFEVFNEIKAYTSYHFNFEEKLMQKYGYKDYAKHCLEHKVFTEAIMKLGENNKDFRDPEMVRNIINIINGWITNHILEVDMQYKDYLNSKGLH